jgi:hypothetical protein
MQRMLNAMKVSLTSVFLTSVYTLAYPLSPKVNNIFHSCESFRLTGLLIFSQ